MIGLSVTKDQINQLAGTTALELKRNYDHAVALNEFLLRTPNADLLALEFTQAEIDVIKSALADLAYQKVQAFDSSSFVKQLYGLGV